MIKPNRCYGTGGDWQLAIKQTNNFKQNSTMIYIEEMPARLQVRKYGHSPNVRFKIKKKDDKNQLNKSQWLYRQITIQFGIESSFSQQQQQQQHNIITPFRDIEKKIF